MQSVILGSFFYGYVVTQIPGGYMAGQKIVSSKWLFGVGILITSVFTVLMPIAAKTDYYLLLAVRVIEGKHLLIVMCSSQQLHITCKLVCKLLKRLSEFQLFCFMLGLGEGVTFPVMHAMLAEWSPPLERSRMATYVYSGSTVGTVLSLSLTGTICEQLGWESVFYIFGGIGVFWFILWSFLVYDNPAK